MIDIGIEPLNLSHKKLDQNEGNAQINFMFDVQEASKKSLKINRISVSTCKALVFEGSSDSGPKTMRMLAKQGIKWKTWRPEPSQGGLPASIEGD